MHAITLTVLASALFLLDRTFFCQPAAGRYIEACLGFKVGFSLASVVVLLRAGTLILEPFGDFAAQNTRPSAFETGGVDCLDSLACVAAKKEKKKKRRAKDVPWALIRRKVSETRGSVCSDASKGKGISGFMLVCT